MNTVEISEKTAKFISNFDRPENNFQQDAFDRLAQMDFPTTKGEYWRYTRLGKIANSSFSIGGTSTERINVNDYIVANDYIIVENGVVREDISQYSKLNFEIEMYRADQIQNNPSFNKNLDQADIFNTLNNAFFDKVISLNIPANKLNEGPLQIIYITQGENVIANTRLLIEAGKSSQNEIIQTFISKDSKGCFTNHVTEVYLSENAHLLINKIQNENDTSLHISTEKVTQLKDSNFKINTITLNGLLVRNNIKIDVDGNNCESHMNGAIIGKGKQHIDNHTFLDHKVSNCESNQNYKYVMDDHSTGVFNGRVVVEKDAQIINAFQNNGNILLSDHASINSKPELEIYADDVKCSHGSTTGQLDPDAIFYLQTRGLSKEKAKKMLVAAFIEEVLEEVGNEKLEVLIHSILVKEHNWDI